VSQASPIVLHDAASTSRLFTATAVRLARLRALSLRASKNSTLVTEFLSGLRSQYPILTGGR
jgi:hypothetical protein